MNEDIERLFPSFVDSTSQLLYYSRMKRYILKACAVFTNEDESPTPEDILDLQKDKNWFLIKDGKEYKDEGTEIERNYLTLLSLLELSSSATVLEFYSKLNYINEKNARESLAYEQRRN